VLEIETHEMTGTTLLLLCDPDKEFGICIY